MPKKKHSFKFKSKKGQDVSIDYTPENVNVSNEKAFQGHLENVVEVIQCSGYGVPDKKAEPKKEPEKPKEPTIKGIDDV